MNKQNSFLTQLRGNAVNGDVAEQMIALLQDMKRWKPQIEEAVACLDGMYSFDDIVASVLRQERQFYDFETFCVIMQHNEFPGYSTYHCFIACGNLNDIVTMEPYMEQIAKELGCKYLTLAGRQGWTKALKNRGWRPTIINMHKEVK